MLYFIVKYFEYVNVDGDLAGAEEYLNGFAKHEDSRYSWIRIILKHSTKNNFCELFNTFRIVRPAMAFSSVIASRNRKKGDRSIQHVVRSIAPFVHVHKGTILRQNLLKLSALQRSLIERLQGSPNTLEFEHRVAMISVQHSDFTEEQRMGIDVQSVEAEPQ